MDKITIYTRSMLHIMRPIVDQVELFSSYIDNSGGEEFPKPEVEDICNPLLQLKNPCFSKDVIQLKVCLRDFYDAVDLMKDLLRHSAEND
ncbi:Protein of unknown function [Gryllus bimaculatus]|nr:Protein of unknown function [Gryllus bimaculatus]